jgi:hypothetical protein
MSRSARGSNNGSKHSGCIRASSVNSTTARCSRPSDRPAPDSSSPRRAIAAYVCEQYRVDIVGCIDAIGEQLFAITTERRLTHPAIVAISEAAHNEVFGDAARSPRADDGAHHREPTVAGRSGHAAGPARPRRKPLP